MKQIQETFKDDREKLGRAMMELYKREKINPLAGCLPMVVQIPVFISFYWVLLESVEMRQAPLHAVDQRSVVARSVLRAAVVHGRAMFAQFKLNPAPPDPMQAKIMQFMPLVMTGMMAWFPSGLVLYWVTNTVLSIVQQWRINQWCKPRPRSREPRERPCQLPPDTIAAIASAAGRGAVGVVRVSGPRRAAHRARDSRLTARSRAARSWRAFSTRAARASMQGIALYFPAPASFTGEHVLELQGHGGMSGDGPAAARGCSSWAPHGACRANSASALSSTAKWMSRRPRQSPI